MRALQLIGDRKVELVEQPDPPPPAAGEVQIRVKAVGLNHLDLWGFRGMAFAKRKMPLVVGAEAAGEIVAVGPDVTAFKPGAPVVIVINDRRELYPQILERAGLRLEERYRRHVNRRTGRRAGELFEDVLIAR